MNAMILAASMVLGFGVSTPLHFGSPISSKLSAVSAAHPTPKKVTASSNPKTIDGHKILHVYHMIATAYGPSLQDNYPYGPVDAFGKPLKPGMIAVDPSIIPLKSRVYVQGYHDAYLPHGGFAGRALDTGGAIKGMRIDIFMNAGAGTVSNFGVQPVTVDVLAP